MIFTAENTAKILAGEKTQTRRIVKPGDTSLGIMFRGPEWKDQVRNGGRVRWRVNDTYALQPGRGKHAVGRIRITEIEYVAHAREISSEDALAEGFSSPEEFWNVYATINGARALDLPCWKLSFSLCEQGKPGIITRDE